MTPLLDDEARTAPHGDALLRALGGAVGLAFGMPPWPLDPELRRAFVAEARAAHPVRDFDPRTVVR